MIGLRRFDDTGDALRHEERMLADVAAAGTASNWTVWTGSRSLVVPRRMMSHPRFGEASAVSAAGGWPVHVRSTGGDATPQGPGIINLAIGMALPPGTRLSITAAYDIICAPIEMTLRTVPGLGRGAVERCFCDGDHNVTAKGRKLAGTAQRWRRSADGTAIILAHALILHDCDIPAAVEAVNALRAALGLDAEAVPDAHVNARGLQGCAYGDIDEFARAVGRAVDVTLTDALGRSRTAAENDEDALQEGQKLMATREMAA